MSAHAAPGGRRRCNLICVSAVSICGRSPLDKMDKTHIILSRRALESIENLRLERRPRWTKFLNFASRIDFREIVTKRTIPPRRLLRAGRAPSLGLSSLCARVPLLAGHPLGAAVLRWVNLASTSWRVGAAPHELHGTVVEQSPRQKPMFSGLCAQTLFHRFEIFFRARRALTAVPAFLGQLPPFVRLRVLRG
jgi:hypothetical protein